MRIKRVGGIMTAVCALFMVGYSNSGGREPNMVPASSTEGNDVSLWGQWYKRSAPVFEGQYKVASDPCILKKDDRLFMFHTGLDVETLRTFIGLSTSHDGLTWLYWHLEKPYHGRILGGRAGEWDENLEACEIIKHQKKYYLYFSGYKDMGIPMKGFPASLSVATSADGVNFKRILDDPILNPTKGWYDNDAVYSPTIIEHNGGYLMLYVGHSYTDFSKIEEPGVYLLAAFSNNGVNWTKHDVPVISPDYQIKNDIDWMRDGAAEPSLVVGDDGFYYLFFTGLKDAQRWIGVARSRDPLGPWDVNPTPIITPTDTDFDDTNVLAPEVIVEQDKIRMWYLGENKDEHISVGYAEAQWPLHSSDLKRQ